MMKSSAWLSVTKGEEANDQAHRHCARAVRCVLSREYAVRPPSAAEQFGHSSCGLGRQLVDGICVRNSAVRAAVRKCSARKMRMVNGRCESRVRPAAGPAAARPAAAPAVAPLRPSNLRLLPPPPVDRHAQLWGLITKNIPQSIRALRAAPGFSKLIAYRMTPPRSFTNLH
jgi:hypothetical protein